MREFICGYATIWQCGMESFWFGLLILVGVLLAIGCAYDWIKGKALAGFRRLKGGLRS